MRARIGCNGVDRYQRRTLCASASSEYVESRRSRLGHVGLLPNRRRGSSLIIGTRRLSEYSMS